MISFGPAGASSEIKEQKMNISDMIKYLKSFGISAYEYPLTYGTNITDESARIIGESFKKEDIKLSVHAPYYINFASPEPENVEKSIGYLLASVKKAKVMGADRVVFHPGSLTGLSREVALSNCIKNIKLFLDRLDEENISGIYICPETMGKHGQVGTWQEVLLMCKLDDRIIPTLDFGHINAYLLGELKTEENFTNILNAFKQINKLGLHVHFSRIEFGQKGELKHLTFNSEAEFGPDYKTFIESVSKFNDLDIRVVCESAGTQTIDSKIMIDYYKKVFSNR